MFVNHLHGGHAATDDALLGIEIVCRDPSLMGPLVGLNLDFSINQTLEKGIHFFLGEDLGHNTYLLGHELGEKDVTYFPAAWKSGDSLLDFLLQLLFAFERREIQVGLAA